MTHQYLTYLMISLIALQSVSAMGDVHQLYQPEIEHVTLEHEHDSVNTDSTTKTSFEENDHTDSDFIDCNHCCHCHGAAHVFLGNHQIGFAITQLSSAVSPRLFGYSSYQASPDNPPPIR